MKARVMIVEDREMISGALKDMLTINGYEVVAVASDGKEALSLYPATLPDIVLMDLLLPDMNGQEVAANILGSFPGARMIAISASTKVGVSEECERAGFSCLVRKPFRMKELLFALDSALRDLPSRKE